MPYDFKFNTRVLTACSSVEDSIPPDAPTLSKKSRASGSNGSEGLNIVRNFALSIVRVPPLLMVNGSQSVIVSTETT